MTSLIRDPRCGVQYVVLRVSGELDLDTQDLFHQAVSKHLERSSVVVDLSSVEFVSVSSLKVLVACHRNARARRHRVVYAALPRQARRLVELAELDRVLDIRETVADATGTAPTVEALDFRAS
jgi:anti-sigma B factor antagonist